MTPTNYVWPASQDRVPSVWCCLTPHWLVNEGLWGGSQGGAVGMGGLSRGVGKESMGVCGGLPFLIPPSFHLFPELQACIWGQLLIHSTFHHNNKQKPHKGRPAERHWAAGPTAGKGCPLLHRCHRNREASPGPEASFSFCLLPAPSSSSPAPSSFSSPYVISSSTSACLRPIFSYLRLTPCKYDQLLGLAWLPRQWWTCNFIFPL